MTTATDRHRPNRTDRNARQDTSAGPDFESTRTFTASAADVLAALRTTEAISSWWAPATGSADPRGTLDVASRSGSRHARAVRGARRAGPGRMVRAPVHHDARVGRHDHRLRGGGHRRGSDAPLPSPWPDAPVRLLRHVRRGLDERAGPPGGLRRDRSGRLRPGQLPGHQEHQRVAGGGARRVAHTGGRRGLVGPLRGLGRRGRDTGRVVPGRAAADRHGGPSPRRRAGSSGPCERRR